MLIDLHVHSTASDGTLSPSDVVIRAKKRAISLLSLTDHDTTDGLQEFEESCRKHNVPGLPGIELSAEYYDDVHILGYGMFYTSPEFQEKLTALRKLRDERNEKMCAKLKTLGYDISIEEVIRESEGDVIARPHIARALMKKGYVSSLREAFDRLIGKGALAYVPRKTLSPEECITLIQNAGGISVLAHPGEIYLDSEPFDILLRKLKDAGLWGLECYSSHHSADEIFGFLELAAKFGLNPTAGSDFHGENRPDVEMGIDVPEHIIPEKLTFLALKKLGNSGGVSVNVHSSFAYKTD
jgi:hypothetical protein